VDDGKKQKLEMTVAAVQARWGARALRRLRPEDQQAAVPHVPTGFPALDRALGIGGLPAGRISEIAGAPTSGMATLALKIVANAQAQGEPAVYIDLERTFDPDYAARCGLSLSEMVLVRPYDARQGLAILQDFAAGGGVSLLACDLPAALLADQKLAQALSATLGRIIAPLSQSRCVLLFLVSLEAGRQPSMAHYPAGSPLPHHAAVRLFIQREQWLYRQQDIRGYRAQVEVIKNKVAAAGKRATITITFNGTVAPGSEG
jgi:recombination protein RecA